MKTPANQCQPRVVVCLYDLTRWYMERTNRSPKNWRVTLGDEIDRLMLRMTTTARRKHVSRKAAKAQREPEWNGGKRRMKSGR